MDSPYEINCFYWKLLFLFNHNVLRPFTTATQIYNIKRGGMAWHGIAVSSWACGPEDLGSNLA